jgi:hypothetical protein
MQNRNYKVRRVYVVFNTEQAKRACLDAMQVIRGDNDDDDDDGDDDKMMMLR